jgi:hypothetical protein
LCVDLVREISSETDLRYEDGDLQATKRTIGTLISAVDVLRQGGLEIPEV